MDEDVIAVLNTYFGNRNMLEVLHQKRDQLKKRDYNILIAGKRRYLTNRLHSAVCVYCTVIDHG